MDKPKTRYSVRESTTTIVRSTDPIVIDSVPCWNVTREPAGGMAWHIGKYTSEKAAQRVAGFLTGLLADEID